MINKDFLIEIVNEINKLGFGVFEINETVGYFSIQRAKAKRYKNVVCFVKDEYVISISEYANIERSFFDNPPYNRLKKRDSPPQGLQLRRGSWYLYPHNFEYNPNEDKDVILQICIKACKNFGSI